MNYGNFSCEVCQFHYECAEKYLKYDYDKLLFEYDRKKYVLNKVLNNNGYLSYLWLKEGSLSLSDRKDVIRFKNYIESYIHRDSSKILDIGCGILEKPGYLNFVNTDNLQFYGIDPIDDKSFHGVRVVGCSEFMPFENSFFDIIVFATSLDHVCSLDKSICECYRTLRNDGKVIVWMSDRRQPLLEKIKMNFRSFVGTLKYGYPVSKFVIYPNFTTFYIPDGAVDPFHSFWEDPVKIIKLFKRFGFQCDNTTYNNNNEIFLCFTKRA
jgi:SAM-dependent methyltransferase